MKKVLLLGTVLIATTALAFGGHGSGRKSTAFTSGVDAIGVHFNGKKCPSWQELVDNECMDKCAEGYKRDIEGACVEICPEERQCGETCCGEGNICIDGDKCCNKSMYEFWRKIIL